MHCYVVGVNGSGKTTLLKAVAARTNIKVIHGTSELMEYLGISGNYTALRGMDQDIVLEKWGQTALQLLRQHGEKPFLLDTHLLNLTNGKTIRRDGDWIKQYDALVLITAKPTTILARIQHDANKNRVLFPANLSQQQKLSMLTEYQATTELVFREVCTKYQLCHIIIHNDDSPDKAAIKFIDFYQAPA
jgi:adenylate kinase